MEEELKEKEEEEEERLIIFPVNLQRLQFSIPIPRHITQQIPPTLTSLVHIFSFNQPIVYIPTSLTSFTLKMDNNPLISPYPTRCTTKLEIINNNQDKHQQLYDNKQLLLPYSLTTLECNSYDYDKHGKGSIRLDQIIYHTNVRHLKVGRWEFEIRKDLDSNANNGSFMLIERSSLEGGVVTVVGRNQSKQKIYLNFDRFDEIVVSSSTSYIATNNYISQNCQGDSFTTTYNLDGACFDGTILTCENNQVSIYTYGDLACTGTPYQVQINSTGECGIVSNFPSGIYQCVDDFEIPTEPALITLTYNGTCQDNWKEEPVIFMVATKIDYCFPVNGNPNVSYKLTCDAATQSNFTMVEYFDATCLGNSNPINIPYAPICGDIMSSILICNN
ncbi:hypothetical protein DFA_06688 [Cavenderia fasciculata]|uniref:Uncharacterized protein n=1 Tax=Cavenderia fasciculata TaxID=261658 RepID=F4Q202_CACFS|nr:uncharacterized protein DFA_06688 [Cavenderia fasciculata]EGG18022.1 hypothetical protein DFA_06688 [Cavenderia fasciculata]|eukprot:XP_004356915.1 hypothetical protein DFA_06688 [Cavenderia fasciculata]